MSPRRLLLAAVLGSALAAADTTNPLDQANLVLRVRDGRWVDREATRFAAAYGSDLAGIRGELARTLFRSNAFDGIDLTRPSLIAWRPGRAPLIAAIPITDRTAFLAAFGAVERNEPPLVRVGERDGTVVYTQNRGDVLWEYRLLVANNTAYLARTVDECHNLAATLVYQGDDPTAAPIELSLRDAALLEPRLPGREWLAGLPSLPLDPVELATVPAILDNAWRDLAGQIAWMTLSARSGPQGDLQLGFRLAARPDSQLAGWVAMQRPGTERLAGQLRNSATALLITGRLGFQGQLERWAFNQIDVVKAAAGVRWSDAADAAFRGLCTLAERSGACAVEIQRTPDGILQQWVVEHPRSVEVAQSTAEVAGALAGKPVETQRLAVHPAFAIAGDAGPSLLIAGERHVLRIDDRGARLPNAATDLIKRLDEPGSLDAAPSLASMWIDLRKAWKAPPLRDGERDDPVVVAGLLRPLGPGQLEFACTIPIQRMAVLLGRIKKPRTDE